MEPLFDKAYLRRCAHGGTVPAAFQKTAVLFSMNVIWRNCICRLRQGKVPYRCQSGVHPVAPLGSRILTDPAKVFEHNMWDHMQWSKEEEDAARKQVEENSATRVAPEEGGKSCVSSAPWNFEEHSEGPGKTENFPGGNATFRILEVGCGAGNCVFPILNTLVRKEQEIPSFHQAVLCLASDVVCSSWIPDGTLHRELGLEHTPHSSYCGISVTGANPAPPHPPHVRSLCLDSKSFGVVVLTTSRKAEIDGDNTNVLLPAL
ncbi:tRNA N(3)-methylcytidine methyltransferase METTL8, mitochondrial [Lemmus lemmus]